MAKDCLLDPDINLCPHFEPNKGECCIKNECCGFYGKAMAQTEPKYIRQPR
jgi:hypothetical protein